ncbi:hypothetical protein BKA66DRAFT_570738 [Pyrenochaeta sp. MPI-SDFR-AT-0127]|nr:hypothetical protein BKA66DRAFT_570738 [Pyrenochaeta sp. MPI-SDFR-AT-0127]
MSHAHDQSMSSSAYRFTDKGAREQTRQASIRTRQAPFRTSAVSHSANELKQLQTFSTRRKASNQPALHVNQQAGEPQQSSPERKSPAFLQGKNPYGQVLEQVEHPYQEPRNAAAVEGTPSQAESSIEGRPRTSGSLKFKTRPVPTESGKTVVARDTQLLPLPARQLWKPASVQAAKIFFETKAAQDRSSPPSPAGVVTINKGTSISKPAQEQWQFVSPRRRWTRVSNPAKSRAPQSQKPGEDPPLPHSPSQPSRAHPAQQGNSFVRQRSEPSALNDVAQTATIILGPPSVEVVQSGSNVEHESTGRRRSTNIFSNGPRDSKSPNFCLCSVGESLKPGEIFKKSKQNRSSEDTVRRQFIRRSTSDVDVGGAAVLEDVKPYFEEQYSNSSHNVPADYGKEPPSGRLRHRRSRSTPQVEGATLGERAGRQKSTKSSTTDLDGSSDIYLDSLGDLVDDRNELAGSAARGLSYDGSSSNPSLSRRSTALGQVPISNIGVQAGYHSTEIPDHIDMRGAYGRRQTQDFGFPGARIKPHRTFRTYKPLQDPGHWAKHACGHFSLRESVKSAPQLVDLLNSAADDLGVDLDRKPTAKDEEAFHNAPLEGKSRASMPSLQDSPLDTMKGRTAEEEKPSEDIWLQQTRRHLTELSEARTQLMDELDSIAEDLGVQLQERRISESKINPIQRVLSKVSTGLSRRSTRLRNKSVDSVAEEIPRMIDEHINDRRLSRVLTHISNQSRRMSALTQAFGEIGEIPPEEIQEWLEVAQTELPAAIDCILAVLETLPALDFEQEDQRQYVEPFVPLYEPEPDYDEEFESDLYEEYAEHMPHRTYTEPINKLQNRIADLERRLRKDSLQVVSPQYEEDDFITPSERTVTDGEGDVEPIVQRMAEGVPNEEKLHVQRSATRKATIQPSTTPPLALRDMLVAKSVSSEEYEDERAREPQSEWPPVVERVNTPRKSSVASHHFGVETERTFSFISPVVSEPEEPIVKVKQKSAPIKPSVLSRQPSKPSIHSMSPLVLSPGRLEPPTHSSSPESSVRFVSARKSTAAPFRKPAVSGFRRDTLPPSELGEQSGLDVPEHEETRFDTPVERIRKATTFSLFNQRRDTTNPPYLCLQFQRRSPRIS